MESTPSHWRKSSYSGNQGGDCVEVAETIAPAPEVPTSRWHKSSYSGNGPTCVEVAETAWQIHVRDTQNRSLGHLTFPGSDWSALLASLR